MSTLNVAFYHDLVDGPNGKMPIAQEPALASEDVDISGGEADSAAAPDDANFVRIAVDAATYIETGSSPTAAAGDKYLPAGHVEYFGIQKNDKVSGILA